MGIFGSKLSLPDPVIAILTRRADSESDDLSVELAKNGYTVTRIDADDVLSDSEIGIEISDFQASFDASQPDSFLSLKSSGLQSVNPIVYLRHFEISAIPRSGNSVGELPEDKFIAAQWEAAMHGILDSASAVIGRGTIRRGVDRIRQLQIARHSGWAIPPTVVSNSPTTLRHFVKTASAERFIIKALGPHFLEPLPGKLLALFPREFARRNDFLNLLPSEESTLENSPVLCQQFVPHTDELRVYVAGDAVLAYAIEKDTPDSLWGGSYKVRRYELSPELHLSCLELAGSLDLDVAAIDLLITERGRIVFLEANPSGDWRWIERELGSREITIHHASHLMEVARARQGQQSCSHIRRPG